MLEENVIQYRGFHNIEEGGKIVGFQICVRSKYYRGVWLSQIHPGKVVVDGITYTKEQVIWGINGRDYTVDELAKAGNDFWRNTEVATLKIMKDGGLSQGYHDVSVRFGFSASYMPPEIDNFDGDGDGFGFGGGTYTKDKMIIV
ncbi:MAG: D-mannonate dehydratase [Lachnospiraceae bacterium]|nr:D-mannonate dehydratase [Lachnospiraceae bacterium]